MQQCSLVAFWNAGYIYTIFRRWRYKGNQGNILIDRYWQWRNYWSRWTLGSLLQIQLLIKASRKLDKRYNLKSWLGSKWQNWIFWISCSLSFWKIIIKNECKIIFWSNLTTKKIFAYDQNTFTRKVKFKKKLLKCFIKYYWWRWLLEWIKWKCKWKNKLLNDCWIFK